MLEAEGVGKTIEQAIESALFELKCPREDVDIKIIDQGGFFKKAKVLVTISEDAAHKYQKREIKRQAEEIKEEPKEIKTEAKIVKEELNEIKEAPQRKTKIIADDEFTKSEKSVKVMAQREPREPRAVKENAVSSKEFLSGLLKVLGKDDAEITETKADDGAIMFEINGENLENLIGHRGDALYSLSYLTSMFAGDGERVRVDVLGYRNKRTETLKALANRIAEKVVKTGRYAKLEPMEASERRIIHLELQERNDIETTSKGTEPHRYIVISKKD